VADIEIATVGDAAAGKKADAAVAWAAAAEAGGAVGGAVLMVADTEDIEPIGGAVVVLPGRYRKTMLEEDNAESGLGQKDADIARESGTEAPDAPEQLKVEVVEVEVVADMSPGGAWLGWAALANRDLGEECAQCYDCHVEHMAAHGREREDQAAGVSELGEQKAAIQERTHAAFAVGWEDATAALAPTFGFGVSN
jgi:hypothetical protein